MYVYTYVCMYVCMYIRMYVCMYNASKRKRKTVMWPRMLAQKEKRKRRVSHDQNALLVVRSPLSKS